MSKIKQLQIKKQNNTRKTILKVLTFSFALALIAGMGFLINLIQFSMETELDFENLQFQTPSQSVVIYDDEGNVIYDENAIFSVPLEEITPATREAFVSIEDKRFYEHNGVDAVRIIGATAKNFKDGSYSEGASTITQQLIKNTQLTSEKTIKRKAVEMKLAIDLEKVWTKDQILEAYLNIIYFGNNKYGIASASDFYFGKQVNKLSIKESALLAGLINAPAVYDPITNFENAEKRANLVLSLMLEQKKISKNEYDNAIAEKVKIVKKQNTVLDENSYEKQALTEACSIMQMNTKQFLENKYKIVTYLKPDIQKNVRDEIASGNYTVKNKNDIANDTMVIVANNENKGVVAYVANSDKNISNIKRQPGSVIKPVLVYAPALEYGAITKDSLILDDEVSLNNYSPSNFNDKYYGWVTISEAIQKSLNIPAIKTMNYVGIEKCKSFAEKLGIEFASLDTGYSLALGGFTNGVSLLELASAYSTFASDGNYGELSFVKSIYDKNNVLVYSHTYFLSSAMKTSTAETITEILEETAKTGTAKRLADIPQIASKTGTVASTVDSTKNTDCYNISYTDKYTFAVWQGNTNGEKGVMESSVNGGTYATILVANIVKKQ